MRELHRYPSFSGSLDSRRERDTGGSKPCTLVLHENFGEPTTVGCARIMKLFFVPFLLAVVVKNPPGGFEGRRERKVTAGKGGTGKQIRPMEGRKRADGCARASVCARGRLKVEGLCVCVIPVWICVSDGTRLVDPGCRACLKVHPSVSVPRPGRGLPVPDLGVGQRWSSLGAVNRYLDRRRGIRGEEEGCTRRAAAAAAAAAVVATAARLRLRLRRPPASTLDLYSVAPWRLRGEEKDMNQPRVAAMPSQAKRKRIDEQTANGAARKREEWERK